MPKKSESMPDEQRRKISEALASKRIGEAPKVCSICKETKPRDMFGRRTNGYSRSECKPCAAARTRKWVKENPERMRALNRATTLRRYYGITEAQYDSLLEAQDGLCLICRSPGDPDRRVPLVVDHCHDSMRIRGLLCNPCNQGIGFLRDSVEILRSAIEYLEAEETAECLVAQPGMPSGVKKYRRATTSVS
ncbi:endonuclease VII domain-containing protein [Streptomyces nigrescens]|uniref:endonuclease VII domain-containing protein n=1 Tax=Streptomyces nigrescens TaxID=1920 RepID=UPI0036BA87E9